MPASPTAPHRNGDRTHRSHRDNDEDDYRKARDLGGSSRSHHSASRYRGDDRHDRYSSSSKHRDDDDRHRHSSRRYDDEDDYSRRHSKHSSSRRDRDDEGHRRHHRKRSYDSDEEDRRRRKKDKSRRRDRDETSQERRDRKAAKRATQTGSLEDSAEERARAAEALMYSAGDNPFNDGDLGQQFRWGKKQERDKKMGLTPAESARRDAERRREAQEEIAKLNASRAQREAEQKIREEEEAKMARLAESAAMSEWVAKEDDFHLEQSRRRAAIRIRENRAKPIDLLAMNLRWADTERIRNKRLDEDEEDDEAGLEIDLEEPYEIFESLTLEETEELYEDIQMYLTLDKDEQNLEFWRSMIIVCDDKLDELRSQDAEDGGGRGAVRSRLDPAVKAEMKRMLATKTYTQLVGLQDQVRDKLRSNEPIDVEYWEQLLKQIVVWRAKAKLRDLHEVVLENRLEYLRRKQRSEADRQQEELVAQMGDQDGVEGEEEEIAVEAGDKDEGAGIGTWVEDEMEPPPIDESRLSYDDRHMPVHTWQRVRSQLVEARRKVLGASFVPRAKQAAKREGGVDASEALFAEEAAKGIDFEEEAFNNEANVASISQQTYDWEDRYRPRKPRYFNRVHTGFEWNKYNQTHYDSDNPPPKTVQGYKFNIFYPDLIDKSKAPTYRIVRENDETSMIIFSAGAPYEDIAFRIVGSDKAWQYSHKRGFRSTFDRGVLQLHFNFQRNFYRK